MSSKSKKGKIKLNDDFIAFLRKRSQVETTRYTAQLTNHLRLQEKRYRAIAVKYGQSCSKRRRKNINESCSRDWSSCSCCRRKCKCRRRRRHRRRSRCRRCRRRRKRRRRRKHWWPRPRRPRIWHPRRPWRPSPRRPPWWKPRPKFPFTKRRHRRHPNRRAKTSEE